MEAIEVTCPRCGGNLEINYEPIIKCKFCDISLINPLMKDEKIKKKDNFEIALDNIQEIEEEIYKITDIIAVKGNAGWCSGQEQLYYGYPTKEGRYRSSSNTRVVSGVYISDEMLEQENGLYMFDEEEQDLIRYYIFCAKTLTEYTKQFTERAKSDEEYKRYGYTRYSKTQIKELDDKMDITINAFKKEKARREAKETVKERI